jgi:putative transposase
MARALRIDVENGWYHVVNRGIEQRQIFPHPSANEHFIELLTTLPERFGVKIHAYVLMGNHYHLQIETPRANLSRAMQWLNLSYSAWFNRLHERSGALFQGRFKAILHDPESTGLTINRYIHLNPVRVKHLGGHEGRLGAEERLGPANTGPGLELIKAQVEALSNYSWSSYPAYAGTVRCPEWLTTETIYRSFGKHTLHSLRGAYRRQLEEMAGLGKWESGWKESVKTSALCGPEDFVKGMLAKLQGDRREQRGVREKERLALDWLQIAEAISKVWDRDWETLKQERGNGALAVAFLLGQRYGGLRLVELGGLGGELEYPAVSAAISRIEKRLKIDRELQSKVKHVRRMLNIET